MRNAVPDTVFSAEPGVVSTWLAGNDAATDAGPA
jgi:hypothetical protein